MAENIDFGRIAFVFEGDWEGNRQYSRLSTVRYSVDGCGYVALKDNTNVVPGTNLDVWMKIVDKGDKGDKGDEPQIGLETDAQGNVYLVVDGVRVTGPGGTSISFKGPKGDKGDPFTFNDLTVAQKNELKGAQGTAAGFGTPTASVNASTGTPSVTVSASGPDTAKVFSFAFSNLKGAKGDKGDKGDPGNNAAVTDAAIAAFGYTKNAGTVTGVKINGTTKNPSSGIVNLGTVITSHQDISGKENTSNKVTSLSAASTNTQYPSAKCVYTQLAAKQPLIDSSHKLDYSLLTNVPASVDVSGKEDKSNKVTSISSSSTDTQYPSAKCVYDIVGNIETLLAAL